MAQAVLPRALARRRVDLRVVVGVFLVLLSVLGAISVINRANSRVEVLVAARPVGPGETIEEGDLAVAEVGLDPRMQGVLRASEEAGVVGRVAAEPLAPGELLTRSSLAQPALPSGFVAMAIPAKPEQAVGGRLGPGDHVAVIATFGAGTEETRTLTLLQDVVVFGVERTRSFSGEQEGELAIVTLLIPPEAAERLAAARANAELDLVLLSRAGGS